MTRIDANRDSNFVPTLLGVSSVDGKTPVLLWADPTTHRLLVDAAAAIASILQTDTFTSTNQQTVFTASKTVAYTLGLYINGSLQTPSSDYTVAAGVATLSSGIPSGNIVVWVYSTA